MNQVGGSRTETLVKLVLIFVISLLSFSVGTFVGKQFSDSQHKMASLEKEFNVDSDEAQSTAQVEQPANKEDALTDEDIDNLTKEFINADKEESGDIMTAENEDAKLKELEEQVRARLAQDTANKPKTVAKTEPTATREVASVSNDVKTKPVAKTADRVAANMAPTPNPKPMKRLPASMPKMVSADSIGKYTVQIASYSLEGDAKSHAKRLIDQGFSAFYIPAKIKGKDWFRVSVGLFGSRKKAMTYRSSFMKQANVSSAIVRKIVQ